MEGFGARGIPELVGRIVMDRYIVYAWAVYAAVVLMSFGTFLWGNEIQSVRGARAFVPLAAAGIVLAFATPTGTHLGGP